MVHVLCRIRTAAVAALAVIVVAVVAVPARPAAAQPEPGSVGEPITAVYIDALFRLFLGRPASAADISGWSPVVHAGRPHDLTTALAASDEWAGVRVDELYRVVLGRPADAAGRRHWIEAIARGERLEDIAAYFYGSDEYFRRAGSTTSGFVARLYDDLLGRAADGTGLRYWTGLLDDGHAARQDVAAAFYASVESRRDRTATTYREVLGRAPDPAGWAYWSDALLRLGDVVLAAHLAASDEFHLRATGWRRPFIGFASVGPGTRYELRQSWRPGCPVHHSQLVAVEFDHFTFDGRVRRGVLIVHRDVAAAVATAARGLYGSRFPLTSARPVDDFGGSDDASMAADNSSAFNCRFIAGTSTWSEHAYGRAVDLNPVRNPYVRGRAVSPPAGAAWLDRSNVRPGMIVAAGPVVRTFDALGWGWGGRWQSAQDYQHLSRTGR